MCSDWQKAIKQTIKCNNWYIFLPTDIFAPNELNEHGIKSVKIEVIRIEVKQKLYNLICLCIS